MLYVVDDIFTPEQTVKLYEGADANNACLSEGNF